MRLLKSIRLKVLGYTDEEILSMMSKIKVSDLALKQYKFHVKGNRHEDIRTLKNKLKRCYLCSKDVQVYDKDRIIAHYGNMAITVINNEITEIKNKFGQPRGFNIDEKLKKRIDDLYWL